MIVQQSERIHTEMASGHELSGAHTSVDKAMVVLTVVIASGRSLSLTEVTQRTGLPKSTTHRLLARLCAHGVLLRQGGLYRPGEQLSAPPSPDRVTFTELVRAASTPFLVELHITTGGTASAYLLSRSGPVPANQVYNHRGTRVTSGTAVPSAVVKLLHAQHPEIGAAIPGRPSTADLVVISSTGIARGVEPEQGTASTAAALRDTASGRLWPVVLTVSGRVGCFDQVAAERALRRGAYALARVLRPQLDRRYGSGCGQARQVG